MPFLGSLGALWNLLFVNIKQILQFLTQSLAFFGFWVPLTTDFSGFYNDFLLSEGQVSCFFAMFLHSQAVAREDHAILEKPQKTP